MKNKNCNLLGGCQKIGCKNEGCSFARYKKNYPDKSLRGVEVLVCSAHFDQKIFNEVKSEHGKIMDALNLIDKIAERNCSDYAESRLQLKAYETIANFIDRHAKP